MHDLLLRREIASLLIITVKQIKIIVIGSSSLSGNLVIGCESKHWYKCEVTCTHACTPKVSVAWVVGQLISTMTCVILSHGSPSANSRVILRETWSNVIF